MVMLIRKKYETENGSVFYVVLDERPAVQTIAGDEAEGELTEEMTFRVTSNSRAFGLHPRYALFGRKIGGDVDVDDSLDYSKTATAYKKVPLLTPTAGDDLDTETTMELGGETFTFIRLTKEKLV